MRYLKTISTYLFAFAAFTLVSCEDPVDVKLQEGRVQLVVDALLFVDDGPQTVKLTLSQPYFDNSRPKPATGALVKLIFAPGVEKILPEITLGNYEIDTLSGFTGQIFGLEIQYEGQTYNSLSTLVRGTVIDTLYQEFREPQFGNEAGTYLYLKAVDSVGVGDFNWLRYSYNGTPNRRPANLTFPADAGFAPGNADGLEYIFPVRNSINQSKPYNVGDTITVELISFDLVTWLFYNELSIQVNNFGLFADPIANVRSNIKNVNPDSDQIPLGCFTIARVSRAGIRIQPN